ncbi:MAG: phosphonate C-P lyase system protein PhnH [Pseudomonadota bacterium]
MTTALASGFIDPPVESSHAFRTFMNAMAQPGTIQPLPVRTENPQGLNKGSTLVMLTLADHEAPIWLDDTLNITSVTDYLKFHCNAPITASESAAMFAVFSSCPDRQTLELFPVGTSEYPDASTTFVIQVDGFHEEGDIALSGPGIKTVNRFGVIGISQPFWDWVKHNNARFPLGHDVLLVSDDAIVALPRTVRVMEVA